MAKTVRQALKGRGDFTSDAYVPGMLYAGTIRSPYPHAAIRNIDLSRLPEGVVCVTASDIPGSNRLVIGDEQMPLLATGSARYVGEPIALVAGRTQRIVVAAMESIYIDYAEQVGSFVTVHPSERRIHATRTCERGSVEAALAASARVVDGSYRTGIQEHLYNEPQGALAEPGEANTIEVRCATQWPYHVRETVAGALGYPAHDVIVRPADPGISLDGKLWYPSLVAAHAALLARATGHPVKLVYSNVEDFRFTSKRAPVTMRVSSGLTESGALHAVDVEAFYNAGAYPLFTDEMVAQITAGMFAHYACPNVRVSVTVVCTNLPPLNVLSGFGAASAYFATESHITRIAEISENDPLSWRVGQVSPAAAGSRSRDVARRTRVLQVLTTATSESDYSRKHSAYELQKKRREGFADLRTPTRGIGIAMAAQGGGFIGDRRADFNSTVTVRLDSDRSATLRTSAIAGSTAVAQGWRRIVAEALGIEQQAVRVIRPDTDTTPDSGPSTLSRNVVVIGRLIEQACEAIQRQRFRKPLPLEVKKSVRVTAAPHFELGTLSGSPYPETSFAAAVVEVSVDPVTFESLVDYVWLVVDGGRIIDEVEARRALEMTTTQALEWASHEIVTYRDGAIDPRSYLTYRNLSEPVRPRVRIDLISSGEKQPMGIGELPQSCIPAALAAAVSQATGRYMDQIPTNPQLIHGYVEQA